MNESISPTDQEVMKGLECDLWERREEANRIMQRGMERVHLDFCQRREEANRTMHRGMERFHRRHEIYAAYAKEKGRDPETLTQFERQEAIIGSILDEVEEV